jgi:hypothetical protein
VVAVLIVDEEPGERVGRELGKQLLSPLEDWRSAVLAVERDCAREQDGGGTLGEVALGELSDERSLVLGSLALKRGLGAMVELAERRDGLCVLFHQRLELASSGLNRVVMGGKLGGKVIARALAKELLKLDYRLFALLDDALVELFQLVAKLIAKGGALLNRWQFLGGGALRLLAQAREHALSVAQLLLKFGDPFHGDTLAVFKL